MTSGVKPVSLLAVAGSLRKESYNRAVLEAAAELAAADVAVSIYEGLDAVPVFNEDLESAAGDPPGVVDLRKAVANSDGLLIASPEYNQSVPGVVKNMIDWLSRGEPHQSLAGRPVAVTGATTGPWGTRISQTLLRQMLISTRALVMPEPHVFIARVESLLDDRGRLVDLSTRSQLEELVSSFADWVRLVSARRLPVG